MLKKLLIVESPAKAKTIGKYLGGEYIVKSSVGHIRDLPTESSAIRIEPKDEGKWEFIPRYEVSKDKEKVVSDLKNAVKSAKEIYLASDPDREGEAIAWHLKNVLCGEAGDKPFHRVTYNEITKNAVLKAVAAPRDIDMPLVDAQQARRILDRLVGYKVSPLLWKNISCRDNRTLSAGRVQSVALRLLVERQREIDAFKPETYFLMGVEARKDGDERSFIAKLARFDGKKPEIRGKEEANNILLDLADAQLEVTGVKAQPKVRHALPPFTTSTLQQAASSVLGFSPGKTMKLAQSLYEQGRITYMRTDSVNISVDAQSAAKKYIIDNFGERFYPEKPNFFKSKADSQGAHEAIRPTDIGLSPQSAELEAAELKLYDLIWRRFMASQMADAQTTVNTVTLEATRGGMVHRYDFTASATVINFEGFLKVMKLSLKKKTADGDEDDESDEVAYLPTVVQGDKLTALRWLSDEKQTKGPTHYSEASLIKALEENGVGRPSTYAATIETIKARGYAKSEKRKLVPTERGIMVCDWLVKKLDSLFNVGYTAQMEAELDKVEGGGEPMNQMLSEFYAKFLKALEACAEPPPDISKFRFVFSLLDQVKEWKPSKKVGRRTYDDKAFVESVKKQAIDGKHQLTARQLEFLVKMAVMYADQIPEVEVKLREAGLGAGASLVKRADPELVKYCFDVMNRIPELDENPFLHSLRDQNDHGRPLSIRQLQVLGRTVAENANVLEDGAEIRKRLADFLPEKVNERDYDPIIDGLLELLKQVKKWRPKAKRGKKMYDDESFVKSLADQYRRRHTLSQRQVLALKSVLATYHEQIPDYVARTKELGLARG